MAKGFGARRCSDSWLRTALPNVPGLGKAEGVSSSDFLSSRIMILRFEKPLRMCVACCLLEAYVGYRLWEQDGRGRGRQGVREEAARLNRILPWI